jgi:hypothetical protein
MAERSLRETHSKPAARQRRRKAEPGMPCIEPGTMLTVIESSVEIRAGL